MKITKDKNHCTIRKNPITEEWIVRLWVNNTHNSESNAYESGKQAAIDTANAMLERVRHG